VTNVSGKQYAVNDPFIYVYERAIQQRAEEGLLAVMFSVGSKEAPRAATEIDRQYRDALVTEAGNVERPWMVHQLAMGAVFSQEGVEASFVKPVAACRSATCEVMVLAENSKAESERGIWYRRVLHPVGWADTDPAPIPGTTNCRAPDLVWDPGEEGGNPPRWWAVFYFWNGSEASGTYVTSFNTSTQTWQTPTPIAAGPADYVAEPSITIDASRTLWVAYVDQDGQVCTKTKGPGPGQLWSGPDIAGENPEGHIRKRVRVFFHVGTPAQLVFEDYDDSVQRSFIYWSAWQRE